MGVPGALLVVRAALLVATLACAVGCGPGRNSRRYRSPEPRTPMVLRQHEPQTDENSPFASGPSEGQVTRDDPRFINLIPVYDDNIVIQDAEGTGHDRMMTEHVPNVSEFTLGASGLSERRITRTDPRFRNLVPVYSDDIIFRDEEGTGADRFMTQRCVEKLKALAISVMNQWPSLKLRVVDGWIENVRPGYPNDSLHYEGRAVDITTSDRDRSKIGMLARLAVEAGFDWVYYETKAHIHCSVKSESSQGARTGGCFTDEGTVVAEGGARKKLSEVRLGDRVLSYDTGSDKLVYSEVIMFLDRDTTARKQFLRLGLSGGQVLTVTPQHLVMRNRPNATDQDVEAVFAAHLKPSDQLLVAENNGTKLVRRTLLSSELVLDTGIIAPLTSVGTIVVDDVIASCYAVIESQSIAHFAFAPLRAIKSVEAGLGAVGRLLSSPFVPSATSARSSTTNSTSAPTTNAISDGTNEGVHWYPKTLYYLSNHFIPSYLLYD